MARKSLGTRSSLRRKHDPEFMDLLKRSVSLDKETGKLTFNGMMYASIAVNIGWKGNVLPIPYSHIVWFVEHGRWPKDGHNLDHINNDPIDNRPVNLREVTIAENQFKRRGRIVQRTYGSGRFGYGICVHHDKRDNRFYVTRNLSRGISKSDTTKNHGLGGYDTLEAAEKRVAEVIELIKDNWIGYLPPKPANSKKKKTTTKYDALLTKMEELRRQGLSVQAIADKLGLKMGVVYRRIRNIEIDCRSLPRSPGNGSKLSQEQVDAIKVLYEEDGYSLSELAEQFGVSKTLIHQICTGKAWK